MNTPPRRPSFALFSIFALAASLGIDIPAELSDEARQAERDEELRKAAESVGRPVPPATPSYSQARPYTRTPPPRDPRPVPPVQPESRQAHRARERKRAKELKRNMRDKQSG